MTWPPMHSERKKEMWAASCPYEHTVCHICVYVKRFVRQSSAAGMHRINKRCRYVQELGVGAVT